MTRRLVLVTGASAGIGAAFARLYAERGWDLALTARRVDRLEALATELRASGAQVLVLPADLAEPGAGPDLLARIAAEGRSVDALVNNAGYGVSGVYADTRWADQQAFLQVLLVAVCALTHAALPGMLERRYGRIVNVASLAGLTPGAAGATLYGATKSFLVRFSQSLHLETRGTGVHVSALCPGFTRSEFHDVTGTRAQVDSLPPWMWSSAEDVVRAGYDAVEANRAVCVPGGPNRAIAALAKALPDDWALALMARQSARFRKV